MIKIATAFHVLAAVIWVGGMFFAYLVLRPALGTIDTDSRLNIWVSTLKRFFPWVWVCIITLLATGFLMISLLGGFSAIGWHVYIMMATGIFMMVIFKFIYAAPFKHLCRGVEEQKTEVANYALGTIRQLVAVNLALGLVTILVAILLPGLL
jgi:uncharacterized membrane protein